MKIHKTAITIKEEDTLHEIVCNICGEKILKNEFGYFEDFLEINKTWGYHSSFDGETHDFDICMQCYKKFLDEMKIKPSSEASEK